MDQTAARALRQQIRDLASNRGPGVLKELIAIVEDKTVPTKLRVESARVLLPFLIPTLEQVTLSDADGEPLRLVENNVFIQQALMADPAARRIIESVVIRSVEQHRQQRALPPSTPLPAPASPEE